MVEVFAPILDMLFSQGLPMSMLGLAVYVLYNRYNNAETEKNSLAKQIVELILKYQHKDEELKSILKQQNDLLEEINEKLDK